MNLASRENKTKAKYDHSLHKKEADLTSNKKKKKKARRMTS